MRSNIGARGRRLATATIMALAAGCVTGAASAGELVDVTIDFAKILKIARPADTIIVGNPGIADAAISDEQTLVLTGKAAGTTNLIVLDEQGAEVMNSVVRVSSDIRQLTTVFYGTDRQTFSCAPTCEQVIAVGDNPDVFTNATTQIQVRKEFSTGQ